MGFISTFCCKLILTSIVYLATLFITTCLLFLNSEQQKVVPNVTECKMITPTTLSESMETISDFSIGQKLVTTAAIVSGCVFAAKLWNAYKRHQQTKLLQSAVEEHLKFRQKQLDSLKQRLFTTDSDILVRREGIVHISAPDLLEALRNGEFTAVEVLEAYQWSALKAQQTTNCIALFIDEARDFAEELDKKYENVEPNSRPPLFGLPVSLKENLQVKGHFITRGFAYDLIHGNTPATEDGIWAYHLKSMGAVPFVRTNVPISMMSLSCSNPVYGTTRHPMDSKRTSGGSSGGEAALIAEFGSPLGIGSDIGGSIRVPAHFCGITGFKPSSRRSTCEGGKGAVYGLPAGPYSSRGPMARDVETLTIFMKHFLGELLFKDDPYIIPLPFRREVYEDGRPLKIGYFDTDDLCDPVPACRRAVHVARDILEKNGHELIPIVPQSMIATQRLFVGAALIDGGAGIKQLLERDLPDPNHQELHNMCAEPWLVIVRKLAARFLSPFEYQKAMLWKSVGTTATDMQRIFIEIDKLKRSVFKIWSSHGLDAVICPGFVSPALSHSTPPKLLFTTAGSVPVTFVTSEDRQILSSSYAPKNSDQYNIMKDSINTQGLPVGVQVAALPNRDEICLRVMKELETGVKTPLDYP